MSFYLKEIMDNFLDLETKGRKEIDLRLARSDSHQCF